MQSLYVKHHSHQNTHLQMSLKINKNLSHLSINYQIHIELELVSIHSFQN